MDWEFIEKEIEQEALEAAQAARRRISERRAARRKRQRRRRIVQAATVGAVAVFAIGMAVTSAATQRSRTPALSAPLPSPEICTPAPTTNTYIGPTATPEATATAKLLESVPLDAQTQSAIFELCGSDPDTFCAIMAIARTESHFDTDAVGDNGVSIGMMQINTRWHTGRMEALGVTDLTDPVQCAAVALDYLWELSEGYGFGWITDHSLYMAYNMGPGNARTALNAGTTSSHYSRSVLAAFEECAAEMEAAA